MNDFSHARQLLHTLFTSLVRRSELINPRRREVKSVRVDCIQLSTRHKHSASIK